MVASFWTNDKYEYSVLRTSVSLHVCKKTGRPMIESFIYYSCFEMKWYAHLSIEYCQADTTVILTLSYDLQKISKIFCVKLFKRKLHIWRTHIFDVDKECVSSSIDWDRTNASRTDWNFNINLLIPVPPFLSSSL